ncbi:MAG: ABC transporter substrate-binding protein [Gammaproteobacteria bacterium]|nr:MAG: ABC transporter substrate-binding protein [Gammaproteobacteria bacterium]
MSVIHMKIKLFIKNTVLFCLLVMIGSPALAKDDFKFTFQPNPRDQLQKINETRQIRIAQQYGLGYLPIMVMREHALIEKHAKQAGLGDVRVQWMTFPSGEKMNQALETGFLDIASGGLVPMINAWDKTRASAKVKGLAALSTMPIFLTSRRPEVKGLGDFTEQDVIALPAPRTSFQAVVLQMAVAKAFGQAQYEKLDNMTIGMKHPEAANEMVSNSSKVTAHFASPPFQYQELDHPGIHKVLSSYDVMDGPSTFTVLWSRQLFIDNNPHTGRAIYNALQEAIDIINNDTRRAAGTYIQHAYSSLSENYIHNVLSRPENSYGTKPLNVMKIADFMFRTGKISKRPVSWNDLFFNYVQGF